MWKVYKLYLYLAVFEKINFDRSDPQKQRHLFFYLNFPSRPFMNQKTAGEAGCLFLISNYHFQPLHRHSDISQTKLALAS